MTQQRRRARTAPALCELRIFLTVFAWGFTAIILTAGVVFHEPTNDFQDLTVQIVKDKP